MKTLSKKIKQIILIVGIIYVLQPTNFLFSQQFESTAELPRIPTRYFGVGLGINDYGLGLNLEGPVSPHFSLNGNVGIGGWGWKLGGSINHYLKNYKNELSLGYSYASGLKDFETVLTVEPNGTKQTVNLDLYSVSTLNLIYTYNIRVGKSSKLALSGGYAICLTQDTYKVNSTVTLDQTSKIVINIMQPGGLIFGIKIMKGSL